MRSVQFGMFNFFKSKPKEQKSNEISSSERGQATLPPAYGEHTKDELTLSRSEVPKAERDFDEWMAQQGRDFEREHPDKKGDEEAFSSFLESRHQPVRSASVNNPGPSDETYELSSPTRRSHRALSRSLQVTGDQLYASDPYAVTRAYRQFHPNNGRQRFQDSREDLAERNRGARRHNDTWLYELERQGEGMTPLLLAARSGNVVAAQQLSRHDRNRQARIAEPSNQRNLDLGRENRSGHYTTPSEYLERLLNEGVEPGSNTRSSRSNHRRN